jgi:hypothetical protein
MDGLFGSEDFCHLNCWTKGKHPVVAMIGAQSMASLQACHEVLEDNRSKRGLFSGLPPLRESDWLKYAARHHRLRTDLLVLLGFTAEEAEGLDWFMAFVGWLSRADRDVVNEATKEEWFRELMSELQTAFVEEAEHPKPSPWESIDGALAVRKPAMVYFLQVEMPLFLRHGEWSATLLRRATYAKAPDFKALDWLLRADRRFKNHPKLRAAIRRASPTIKAKYWLTIKKSIALAPKSINRKRLKILFAGLLSQVARAVGSQLRGPDIRKLFDLEAPCINGIQKDRDLPATPEGLQKQLVRARLPWCRILPV